MRGLVLFSKNNKTIVLTDEGTVIKINGNYEVGKRINIKNHGNDNTLLKKISIALGTITILMLLVICGLYVIGKNNSSGEVSAADSSYVYWSESSEESNESESSSEANTDSESADSASEGSSSDNMQPDSENEQIPDGQEQNGQEPNDQTPGEAPPNGQSPDGQGPNGQAPDGQAPDGQAPNGQAPEGETPSDQ
jgi:FtsZ-interacting cell division protein ZipA